MTSPNPASAAPATSRLPRLYAMWVLDLIVDVAYSVSWDFAKRPRRYHGVTSYFPQVPF
jgi:hypothetical protein